MTGKWDIKQIVDLVQLNWHKRIGLGAGILLGFLIVSSIVNSIKPSQTMIVSSYILTSIFVFILWFMSNKTPKTPKGKIGFVVCIKTSNEEEERVIKEDFISTLRNLLKTGKAGHTFHFIEIPQYKAKTVKDIDDAYSLKVETKCHFLIFGRVRLRKINGKDCHILDLDGMVGHRQLNEEIQNALAKEFGELFPRKLQISKENDLFSFNFTSEWTEYVAKYIIGIASACSFDLDYAEILFTDVQKKIEGKKTDFPIFGKLKERIPLRLSEINIVRSRFYLNEWRKTNKSQSLEKFFQYLNQISNDFENDYEVLVLRGIREFLNGRNIDEAIKITKKCKKYDDAIWHFNLAFLQAYQEDLHKSIRQYRICSNFEISPMNLSEIEEFLVWILEEEPEKYQFFYCLGFFNWKIKGDLKQAIIDFQKFLDHKDDRFIKEKSLSEKWLSEIKACE
ncbi:MAG: hypothetical protein PF503_08340 [Desulfobacula sp.]|jgi:tetratricopeptide (TPR) repeat protein|nr:hypothetical protein [Desulfobacula sp.]